MGTADPGRVPAALVAEEQLAEWGRLANEASPGPWSIDDVVAHSRNWPCDCSDDRQADLLEHLGEPWELESRIDEYMVTDAICIEWPDDVIPERPAVISALPPECCGWSHNEGGGYLALRRADAEFIMAAREAIPALLAALRAAAPGREVVEAACAHVDQPGEDSYRALIDAVCAYRVREGKS